MERDKKGRFIKGRRIPEYVREKIRRAHLGKKVQQNVKNKMSESHIRWYKNPQNKDKIKERQRKIGLSKRLVADIKEIERLYCKEMKSIREIGKIYNLQYGTLYRIMRREGISIRPPLVKKPPKPRLSKPLTNKLVGF